MRRGGDGPEGRNLGQLTWPELTGGAAGCLLVVPLGATEQHGPHLPLATDTTVAAALAERLRRVRGDVVVAPALPYGSSGEHAGFPGTLSIGQGALETVLVELIRSADAFAGVLLVSGHGGNAAAVGRAVATGLREGRRVRAWAPTPAVLAAAGLPVDAHAGRLETSLHLAIDPGGVHPDRQEAGATAAVGTLAGRLRAGGVAAVSPNGVLGDPSGASAAEGAEILACLTGDLLAAVEGWPPPGG